MPQRLPFFVLAALAWTFLGGAPAHAKGKLNCRNLSFSGQAGMCVPPDYVQFQMVDALGNVIQRSCNNVAVLTNETAVHFGSRMPRDLGNEGDGDCGAHILEPDPPTKRCINGIGGSCKYKWKAKKQVLEVCCWQDQNCSGRKVGNYCSGGTNPLAKCSSNADCTGGGVCLLRTGTQGISAQKQIQGTDPIFGPTPVPVGVASVLVQLDPIGMSELPFPALGSCRAAEGAAITGLASTITRLLVDCHAKQLKGEPIADCTTINTESDPAERAQQATNTLVAAAQACAPGGSPAALGYGACPAPCDGIVVNTCAEGLVGAPCANDTACDSSVGSNDGKCGRATDWGALGSCMACVTADAITTAVDDKYGTVAGGLADEEIKCQDEIGKILDFLVESHLKVIRKCQKLLDGGKTALKFCQNGICVAPSDEVGLPCMSEDACAPPDARVCKNADQGSGRALAEVKGRAAIDKGCATVDLDNLDSCDTTLEGLEDCVVENARDAAAAISDAVFPEGIGH